MKILFVGDLAGKPGVDCLLTYLEYCRQTNITYDFIMANVENAAGGFGLTKEISQKIFSAGVQCQTTGNHIWDRKEIFPFFETESRLLRPGNYPPGAPGLGFNIYGAVNGLKVAVINLQGRIFMWDIDCPFRTADSILPEIQKQTNIILVDFHAEATSEKQCLGWYLDGRVTAVMGTHTHVQTADERILPNGTAFICDVGMTGPYKSVIGMEVADALQRVISAMPNRLSIATEDIRIAAVEIEVDETTGKAIDIKRILMPLEDFDEFENGRR